jgi:hypothetical protein
MTRGFMSGHGVIEHMVSADNADSGADTRPKLGTPGIKKISATFISALASPSVSV